MAKLTNLKARLKVWLNPLTSWRAALDELKPYRIPSDVKLGRAFHSQQPDFELDRSQVGKIKMGAIFRFVCGQNFKPWVKFEDVPQKHNKAKNHWGLLDYMTGGVLRAVESVFRGDWIKNPKARKIVFWSACLIWAPLTLARYSISAALMLIALPIGGIIWAKWDKRQKIKSKTTPVDPKEEKKEEPLNIGDKVTIKKSGQHIDWDKVPPLARMDTYYRVQKIAKGHLEATVVSTAGVASNPDYFTEQKYYKVVLHDDSFLGTKNAFPNSKDMEVRALKNFGDQRNKKHQDNDPTKPTINRTHFDSDSFIGAFSKNKTTVNPNQKMEESKTYAYFGRYQ